MRIASIVENQKFEKRIAITPEIAKKYMSLGFEVSLSKNYGSHIGIKDEVYKNLSVSILNDDKEIINNADIIVQLGLLDNDKSSLLKQNQTLIGVLNPYDNKDKIDNLVKKKRLISFHLNYFQGLQELNLWIYYLPRQTLPVIKQ